MKKIIIMVGIAMILTSCVKDFDINPSTTIGRIMFQGSK